MTTITVIINKDQCYTRTITIEGLTINLIVPQENDGRIPLDEIIVEREEL